MVGLSDQWLQNRLADTSWPDGERYLPWPQTSALGVARRSGDWPTAV
ncbi:hypothetical protein PPTG_14968 [Phytophthora nicotianae INRA-310]|uniref:Uncharacterized protein n=1 Tax=Phytophthora nicotianae (strain INRA-310) TaxID=761204 RepID=W2PTK7_PHYN3|nr:hypothetical protein PPTG_14968 [Phytophthora nicotianae INRA-310]ETN04268.1 hypothetical protein PPTG_14968 [Phytophthora nicotianae INRA-310]